MKKFVITVAREYGSGGKTIGKMLAKELNIPCYNNDLLRLASEESGINLSLFANADERLKNSLLFKTARGAYTGEVLPPDSDGYLSAQNLFNIQAKIIKELAEKESCVIIGRCSDFILKDTENVLRLYVHAPLDYCIARAKEVHPDMSDDQVRHLIQKTDKRRSDYYNYFTGGNWKDADNYDLCINSSQLSWDQSVSLVKAYLEIKLT